MDAACSGLPDREPLGSLMTRERDARGPEEMNDCLAAALRERPVFVALTSADLKPLPATGTAHGHVRLPSDLLARVAYAHEGDPAAAARLATQAEAFRHLAPAGRTPRLHDVIEPRPGLPGGALIVDRIEGRAPLCRTSLVLMADTLARIHSLPLPAAGSSIPRQENPFLETLTAIDRTPCASSTEPCPRPARAPRSPRSFA